MTPTRLRLLLPALLACLALAAASGRAGAAEGHCYGFPGFANPALTEKAFLNAAVERKGLSAAYTLTTRRMRRGLSCAGWLADPEVAPFPSIDWSRSKVRAVQQTDSLELLSFHLVSRSGVRGQFEMRLVRVGDAFHGLWRVDLWQAEYI